jgi:hypothetical protein
MNWYYPGYYLPYIPETPVPGTFLEGGLPLGASYLYPDAPHVLLHVLDADTFDDTQPYNPVPTFRMLYAPVTYTGGALIARLGGGKKDYLQEVYEQGGGFWVKGMKIENGSEAAKKKLEEYGWKRGAGPAGMPVWVVVKKAG